MRVLNGFQALTFGILLLVVSVGSVIPAAAHQTLHEFLAENNARYLATSPDQVAGIVSQTTNHYVEFKLIRLDRILRDPPVPIVTQVIPLSRFQLNTQLDATQQMPRAWFSENSQKAAFGILPSINTVSLKISALKPHDGPHPLEIGQIRRSGIFQAEHPYLELSISNQGSVAALSIAEEILVAIPGTEKTKYKFVFIPPMPGMSKARRPKKLLFLSDGSLLIASAGTRVYHVASEILANDRLVASAKEVLTVGSGNAPAIGAWSSFLSIQARGDHILTAFTVRALAAESQVLLWRFERDQAQPKLRLIRTMGGLHSNPLMRISKDCQFALISSLERIPGTIPQEFRTHVHLLPLSGAPCREEPLIREGQQWANFSPKVPWRIEFWKGQRVIHQEHLLRSEATNLREVAVKLPRLLEERQRPVMHRDILSLVSSFVGVTTRNGWEEAVQPRILQPLLLESAEAPLPTPESPDQETPE